MLYPKRLLRTLGGQRGTFDSPFFDCTTDPPDNAYVEVHSIVNGAWMDMPGSSKTNDVFEMRRTINWKGPGTVCDVYLLSNNQCRE